MFRDESPLINLGYTAQQRRLLTHVLRTLEGRAEIRFHSGTTQFFADFGDENGWAGVNLAHPTRLVYDLSATYDHDFLIDGGFDSRAGVLLLPLNNPVYEDEAIEILLNMSMVTGDVPLEDLNRLVRLLYEDASPQRIRLWKEGAITNLASRISPKIAPFKVTWLDDTTKLDLVVESNALPKYDQREKRRSFHVWRRLPTVELCGQQWNPFGSKPNVSQDRIMKLLQDKKEGAGIVFTLEVE